MKQSKRILLLLCVISIITSVVCDEKSDKDKAPVVGTSIISVITTTTASGGGDVITDGGSDIIARGICWSISQNPTVVDSHTVDGTGLGIFVSSITGLSANTTYYVKAYATNSVGTSYGNEVSFETNPTLPTVSTASISSITTTSAESGGNVTADGGSAVTERGLCWRTSQNPTVADSHKISGSGTGPYTCSITGLSPSTTYYVRAFATNSVGTAYGNQVSFITDSLTSTFIDPRDGHVYKIVQVGSQVWFAENLNYRTSDSSWYYNDDSVSYHIYGRLYTWNMALLSSPPGWRLPTDADWSALEMHLGGSDVAGRKLKETGIDHWLDPNDATNETGFAALPGGFRSYDGSYYGIGQYGYWWSATKSDTVTAWNRYMGSHFAYAGRFNESVLIGYSIRCIKN